ncbi:DMT family transporter [Meridianimarinicoccus sp. MJW13]|uniref:DMT family transporter n=1 Tax=Meridianimarinicoccus sp. MJW13 TaxID=2720031 RepID=UPI00186691D6|nr:DMT family transporter [Fluviibacterium sp. MJW13]
MTIATITLALVLGAIVSIYFPMIARSAQILGSGSLANVPFFAIAFVSSVAIALATGSRAADFQKIGTVPLWLLSAGIMSAGMILGSSYLIPRLGLGVFFVLLVSGQVLAGMVFGQLGLFGMAQSPLSLSKLLGAAMVIGGVTLITLK